MPENDPSKAPVQPPQESLESLPVPPVNVLSGAESLLGTETHVGIAIRVRSSGGPSVLVIPDVKGAKTGAFPVYITKPIRLELEKLKTFLNRKEVSLPPEVDELLKDTSVACDAFYYTANNGPLLMMFTLQFKKGLISTLTGDPDVGELFDIEGVTARVFRCSEGKFPVLQKYAAELADGRGLQRELTGSS
jgi:hypothetical protein